mgnify:FL=1
MTLKRVWMCTQLTMDVQIYMCTLRQDERVS